MPNDTSLNLKILVLGESHATAISRAAEELSLETIKAFDVRRGSPSKKFCRDQYSSLKPEVLVLAFGGTEHNIVGLIEADPKFDFYWPPFSDYCSDRHLLPASALEELLRHRIRSGLDRALDARSAFDCPAFALAPPPPFRKVDEMTLLPSAFSGLLEAGITPAPIRRKLYAMGCALMREAYASHGIPLIEAPTAALDEDGYLHRHLWGRDPTHGNHRYGSLVLDRLSEEAINA
ncbi:hypothetical protein [Novosphingobium olei]|uniref:hypothetical protein n=1 Tax=Novosphingobium olei TaxID=2728851 RepID=UPI003090E4E8|nr:hypothetical protein NSDW_29670 [Novosphingobium olei]